MLIVLCHSSLMPIQVYNFPCRVPHHLLTFNIKWPDLTTLFSAPKLFLSLKSCHCTSWLNAPMVDSVILAFLRLWPELGWLVCWQDFCSLCLSCSLSDLSSLHQSITSQLALFSGHDCVHIGKIPAVLPSVVHETYLVFLYVLVYEPYLILPSL